MCSCAPHVLLSHLLGLLLGIMVIAELVRRGLPSRLFWSAVIAVSLIMAIFTFHVSEPQSRFDDFITAYWIAGEAALRGPNDIVALYGDGITGFVNIPILAYPFAPFAIISPSAAALLFTVLGVVAVLVAIELLSRSASLDNHAKALLIFLFAAFGPLMYSIREANTSHVVLALCAWAFFLLRERRDLMAGVALGLAAVIKLPLLLFGIYFALRGRWRAAAGGSAVVGVVGVLSLVVFGWDAHVRWYDTSIVPFARAPMPALNVQSIAGAIARLELGPSSLRDWSTHELAPLSQLVARGLTVLLVCLALASAIGPRPRTAQPVAREAAHENEFLIVLMLACVLSTLSWSHYYTWMLMPIAFFLGRTRHFSSDQATRALGWLAIVVGATPVIVVQLGSEWLDELYARFGSSGLLVSGIFVLGLLIRARWQMQDASESHISKAGVPEGNRPSATV